MKGKAILASRLVYAIAWFFVAPAIPKILERYNLPPGFTGLIPVAFFVATGIMQVPSALISLRLGAKMSYMIGLAIMGVSEVSIGLSRSLLQLLLSYFATGIGASLFFSSAGGLLASLNPGREGRAMGLYNAFFSIGGTLGYLWGFLEGYLGFDEASVLLGLVTITTSAANAFTDYPNPKGYSGRVNGVKEIVIVSLSTSGVWGIYYLVAEAFPSFVYFFYKVPIFVSSAVAAALTLSSAIGGFLAGRAKAGNFKALAIFSALGVIPALGVYANQTWIISLLLLGTLNELAISVVYSITLKLSGKGLGVLGLAIVNSGNILGGIVLVSLTYLSLYYSFLVATLISLAEIAAGYVMLSRKEASINR